jgi:hypothetical protein
MSRTAAATSITVSAVGRIDASFACDDCGASNAPARRWIRKPH